MITKDYLRSFLELLENGSDSEIEARITLLQRSLRDHTLSRDMRADCRFLLHKLQEEEMVRSELKVGVRFRKEPQRA